VRRGYNTGILCYSSCTIKAADRPGQCVYYSSTVWQARVVENAQVFITAYHPQTDGRVERQNRVITDMLAKLTGEKISQWPRYLDMIAHTFHAVENSTTGYLFTWLHLEPINGQLWHSCYVTPIRHEQRKVWRCGEISELLTRSSINTKLGAVSKGNCRT
jgi:hypothetical protein